MPILEEHLRSVILKTRRFAWKIFLNIYFFFYYVFEYLSAFVYMNYVLDESP